MSIGDIGDDDLAHVLEFVQDSVRAWAAVSLVNKSFNRAKLNFRRAESLLLRFYQTANW